MKLSGVIVAIGLLFWGFYQTSWASDVVWIDVRTAEEYAADHVPQAINIPYEEIAAGVSGLDLAIDQTIYLYCGSGRRAGIAQDSLEQLGYRQVVNLGSLKDALDRAAEEEQADSNE